MAMAWYTAVFLGLVQGLAEFLPISSSGHLLMFEHFFGLDNGGLLLTLVLHLATLLAVVVVYRQKLCAMLRHPCQRDTWLLLLATAVTCGVVIIFKDTLEALFTFRALPWLFLTTAVVLILPTLIKKRPNMNAWVQAGIVGLAQGIAVLPGLSRSGLTMTAGQLSGQTPAQAVDFSFLLSIPIIIASLCFELLQGGTLSAVGWDKIALAFTSAFIAGLVAIKWLLKLVQGFDLRWFSGYLLLLGGGLLLYIGF